MKRLFAIVLLIASAPSAGPAHAAQCWCTFDNGQSECTNISYARCMQKNDFLGRGTCQWFGNGFCPVDSRSKKRIKR